MLVALPLALAACGGEDEEKEKKGLASATCGSDIEGTASKALPSDLPGADGQKVYSYTSQGKTEVWFATTSGGLDDLVSTRDAIADKLKNAGYTIKGTDQEEDAEAEAEFGGKHEGSIQVQPICKDTLRIRYKIES